MGSGGIGSSAQDSSSGPSGGMGRGSGLGGGLGGMGGMRGGERLDIKKYLKKVRYTAGSSQQGFVLMDYAECALPFGSQHALGTGNG